ncbi:hypothetical protein [Methanobacterium alcaliphilum]|uniref:hypothetical protein n=1 Tax=Methanobacterium alcaliphilum TaxID=392018 RepID=UPI00200B061A|nr:hypothetical protein [Methanobacterium alcaliphilum]MCK9152269.1 hypothetical protein [Methanobacterium alcaliphilum]
MGYKKLGMAVFMALISESAILTKRYWKIKDLKLYQYGKYGSIFKENIGLTGGNYK